MIFLSVEVLDVPRRPVLVETSEGVQIGVRSNRCLRYNFPSKRVLAKDESVGWSVNSKG